MAAPFVTGSAFTSPFAAQAPLMGTAAGLGTIPAASVAAPVAAAAPAATAGAAGAAGATGLSAVAPFIAPALMGVSLISNIIEGNKAKRDAKRAQRKARQEQAMTNLINIAGGKGVARPAPIVQQPQGPTVGNTLGQLAQVIGATQDAAQDRAFRERQLGIQESRAQARQAQVDKAFELQKAAQKANEQFRQAQLAAGAPLKKAQVSALGALEEQRRAKAAAEANPLKGTGLEQFLAPSLTTPVF